MITIIPSKARFCYLVCASCLFFSNLALADFTINSETSREQVIAAKSKKIPKSKKPIQRISLGGSYDFDQNSKQYQFITRYFYQSNRFIHELNFLHETEYADTGSGKNKKYKMKTSELYDFSTSNKAVIAQTKNYAVFYHRTVYDDLSSYYNDLNTAFGLGRMFFNDVLEFDLSFGYHSSKNYGHEIELVPSIRLVKKLTKKLTLNHRGYWFIDNKSIDDEMKTSLIYRLTPRMSFETRHTFEKRSYIDTSKRRVNQVRNLFTIGLVFDL